MDSRTPARWAVARRRAVMGLAASLVVIATPAWACDLCAIYTGTNLREDRVGVRVGVGQQFTRFGTERDGGHEVPNPGNEYLNSAITQVALGYQLLPEFGVLTTLPIISRTYRRNESSGSVKGDSTGVGDMSLTMQYAPYSFATEETVARLSLFAGLTLPTGNSDALSEELAEGHDGEDDHTDGGAAHSEPDEGLPSGIHGHDLARGSGSVDGILGAQVFTSWRRVFIQGAVQYLLRTRGSFNYTYANDLMWNAGPGFYLITDHDYTLRLLAVLSGETKGNDTADGVKFDDTAITTLYVGPAIGFTYRSSLSVELQGALPAIQNNTGLQLVPDYRINAGVAWYF